METYEQKKRRLFGKQYLSEYLNELNAITNIEVKSDMLLSIVESDLIGNVSKVFSYKAELNFEDKKRLQLLVEELIAIKDGSLYLFTAYSEDCGLLRLNSLSDFNINFNFHDEHAGLIKITLEDLSNELILDFYEENNQHFIDIEIYGNDWYKAKIEN